MHYELYDKRIIYVLIILTALYTQIILNQQSHSVVCFAFWVSTSFNREALGPSCPAGCLAEVQVAPTCNGEAMIQVMKREKLLDMLDGQKLSTQNPLPLKSLLRFTSLQSSSVMSEDDVSICFMMRHKVDGKDDECR